MTADKTTPARLSAFIRVPQNGLADSTLYFLLVIAAPIIAKS